MHVTYSILSVTMAAITSAMVVAPLTSRAIGDSCTTPDGDGTCELTSDCAPHGFSVPGPGIGYCPWTPNDVQCCVKTSCKAPSGSGTCMNTGNPCGGSFVSGYYCPGDDTIQCCVGGIGGGGAPAPAPSPPSAPAPPKSGGGDGIVSAAVKEEGLPYVWGGGGCSGPSSGGFDCSGNSVSDPSCPLH